MVHDRRIERSNGQPQDIGITIATQTTDRHQPRLDQQLVALTFAGKFGEWHRQPARLALRIDLDFGAHQPAELVAHRRIALEKEPGCRQGDLADRLARTVRHHRSQVMAEAATLTDSPFVHPATSLDQLGEPLLPPQLEGTFVHGLEEARDARACVRRPMLDRWQRHDQRGPIQTELIGRRLEVPAGERNRPVRLRRQDLGHIADEVKHTERRRAERTTIDRVGAIVGRSRRVDGLEAVTPGVDQAKAGRRCESVLALGQQVRAGGRGEGSSLAKRQPACRAAGLLLRQLRGQRHLTPQHRVLDLCDEGLVLGLRHLGTRDRHGHGSVRRRHLDAVHRQLGLCSQPDRHHRLGVAPHLDLAHPQTPPVGRDPQQVLAGRHDSVVRQDGPATFQPALDKARERNIVGGPAGPDPRATTPTDRVPRHGRRNAATPPGPPPSRPRSSAAGFRVHPRGRSARRRRWPARAAHSSRAPRRPAGPRLARAGRLPA